MSDELSPMKRGVLAGVTGLAGAVAFVLQLRDTAKPAAWVPAVALALACLLAPIARLYAQLLARGIWWSNLVLGVLLSVAGSRSERLLGVALTLGCSAALLIADRRALLATSRSAGFRPAAYGGTLQLLLVLALADAQTLGFFAYIESSRPHDGAWKVLAVASVAMLVGFVGLLRLSLWGVFTTMGTALMLSLALVLESARPDHALVKPLLVIAALQIAVPLPMVASILTRRPIPAPSPQVREGAANAVVALVAVASVVVALTHG